MSYDIDTVIEHVQQKLSQEQINDCDSIFKAIQLQTKKLGLKEYRLKLWVYPGNHSVTDIDGGSMLTRYEYYKEKDRGGNIDTKSRIKYHIVFRIFELDENDFSDFFHQAFEKVVT